MNMTSPQHEARIAAIAARSIPVVDVETQRAWTQQMIEFVGGCNVSRMGDDDFYDYFPTSVSILKAMVDAISSDDDAEFAVVAYYAIGIHAGECGKLLDDDDDGVLGDVLLDEADKLMVPYNYHGTDSVPQTLVDAYSAYKPAAVAG